MGSYVKEFAPIIEGKGIMEISLLIEHSFETKSVYFEIYNNRGNWTLYWNFETPLSIIKQGLKNSNKLNITYKEVIENEELLHNIRKLCDIYMCELNEEEIFVTKHFLDRKLPKVERNPFGLDGHSYTVKINGDDNEYRCWCVIPQEWDVLRQLIEMIVKRANLSDEYLVVNL